ncbi:MAG: transcription-repair coupling factor [Oscillospiraceae bacterium]|nr:MAG: transcription-repair coupling factor [Oscillospiraceae bacterium]
MRLGAVLSQIPQFNELLRGVSQGQSPFGCVGLSQIHKAHFAAGLFQSLAVPTVLIAPDEPSATRLWEDLRALLPDSAVLLFPTKELMLHAAEAASGDYEFSRLGCLESLRHGRPLIVAPAEAAMQYTISPEALTQRSTLLKGSFDRGPEGLVEALLTAGYTRCEQVEGVCTFATRGGIVDFFSPAASDPVRVEFWGDEIDSITYFSPDTQRRGEFADEVMITPAREALPPEEGLAVFCRKIFDSLSSKSPARITLARMADQADAGISPGSLDRLLPILYGRPYTLLDHLAPDGLLLLSDPAACRESLSGSNTLLAEEMTELLEAGIAFPGCDRWCGSFDDLLCEVADRRSAVLDTFARSIPDLRLRGLTNVQALALAPWGGELSALLEDLRPYLHNGSSVTILLPTRRGCDALVSDLAAEGIPARYAAEPSFEPGVQVTDLTLSAGFEYPAAKAAVIGHARAAAPARKLKKRRATDAIRSLSDLTRGDYVVHAAHGIGVFEGIVKREVLGVPKDYIKIRYQGTDTLFVPVTQLDLVSKYIGKSEDGVVRLSKLGSAEWQKTRSRVRAAVADMAEELTALYKKRLSAVGFSFSPDTDWQRDFELRFPYEETDDQLRCIAEIKSDMESSRPMDRLLCGDVGFGKTEVALRAAFKCVNDSKQCAVLVPTTILAWQHYQTFTHRLEGFPVKVELLSRFRTPKQQAEIIKDLRRGQIDIIIGTHRLLQKDVEYHDLGLCIIDEEQRFGVAHKERFKELRESVDVLTLSATPIPRTLSMAMSGIRDMSIIEEAPQDRHPVQTYVIEQDWGILTEALRRELRRGGQAFYLHNRVESIDGCAAKLREFLPDARIAVAHGKMTEEQLSRIWQGLVDREIDILVCTTIIETGVDVPNCNTLIIEDADRMGLSQLYQLRGRVGRSTRRAFAYLTFRPMKALSEIAQKRLNAIKEFTSFGSGFRIAMRDMEIRGAGSVLGAQQHGHMEAVGYEMYLRLLSEAVAESKGEPIQRSAECQVDIQVAAHIPEDYIDSLALRLDIYKKIAAVQNESDASDLLDELIDRFGEPPAAVGGLIDVALLRNRAAALGIREINQRNDQLLFFFEHIDPELAIRVASALKGRVLFNAGAKPYLSVRMRQNDLPVDLIRETLAAAEP